MGGRRWCSIGFVLVLNIVAKTFAGWRRRKLEGS